MNTDKLSTGGASPSAKSKKREGEKRKSPCTPLREKGKGKEDRRGSLQNRLSRARMRKRLRLALDADLDIAVRAFNGTADDRRIWASIAWRIGIEEFHYALLNKLSEDSSDNAPRRPAAAFQAFLNERFPREKHWENGRPARSVDRPIADHATDGTSVVPVSTGRMPVAPVLPEGGAA